MSDDLIEVLARRLYESPLASPVRDVVPGWAREAGVEWCRNVVLFVLGAYAEASAGCSVRAELALPNACAPWDGRTVVDALWEAVGGEEGARANVEMSERIRAEREAAIERTRPADLDEPVRNPLKHCSVHVSEFALGTCFTADGFWYVPPGRREWLRVDSSKIAVAKVLYQHGWRLGCEVEVGDESSPGAVLRTTRRST